METYPSDKKITLKYFSSLAEEVKKSSEEYRTSAQTAEELWQELSERYGLQQQKNHIRPSINHQFCEWQSVIKDLDVVSFIPPVSGG